MTDLHALSARDAAQRIAEGDVPSFLADKHILALDDELHRCSKMLMFWQLPAMVQVSLYHTI